MYVPTAVSTSALAPALALVSCSVYSVCFHGTCIMSCVHYTLHTYLTICMISIHYAPILQWSLRTMDTLGAGLLSIVERCPYLGD